MYEQKIKNQLSKNENPKESAMNRKHKSDQQYLDTLNPLIMRNFYIILDATKTSKISDFKPSRLSVALKYLAVIQYIEVDIYRLIFRVKSPFLNRYWSCLLT